MAGENGKPQNVYLLSFGGFDIAVIAFHYQMHRSDSVFRL